MGTTDLVSPTTASNCGTVSNTASVTTTNDGSATSTPAATVTINCPDVSITKSGNGPLDVGDTATFTLTVHNAGPGTATGVSVSDSLPGSGWSTSTANCSISGPNNN